MSITYELFFQIFNSILLIVIPICIYKLIRRFVLHRRSVDERLSSIEKKLDNLK